MLLEKQLRAYRKLTQSQDKESSVCPASLAQAMQSHLKTYNQCRQFQPGETQFRHRLLAVQEWQAARVARTHEDFFSDKAYRPATEFMLQRAYVGVDFTQMSRQIERVIPFATRVFPNNLLNTAVIGLELNQVTAKLDEQLTETIFETLRATALDEDVYMEAFLRINGYSLRNTQLALMERLAMSLDKYVSNKLIYMAFRLARSPARAAGLEVLYEFMEEGFTALRTLDSTAALVSQILEREYLINERVQKQVADPFCLQMGYQSVV